MIDPSDGERAEMDKDALLKKVLVLNVELQEQNAKLVAQVEELTRRVAELVEKLKNEAKVIK